MKIIWYRKAEQDLNNNIAYIALNSPQNAIKVLDELLAFIDSFSLFPYKYPKEPVYNIDDIRFAIKWHFKIIYRVGDKNIYILRIFNTYQNPEK
jgi:plasmid stabilization system protein ParE